MPEITTEQAVQLVAGGLDEAFGLGERPGSYFTDKSPQAGLIAIVDAVDADAASQVHHGNSVAAQVFHIAFWCFGYARLIEGDDSTEDWSKSWDVSTVSDDEWNALRRRLREGHQTLRRAIEMHGATREDAFRESVGAVAHVAYHLGEIRQKVGAMQRGKP